MHLNHPTRANSTTPNSVRWHVQALTFFTALLLCSNLGWGQTPELAPPDVPVEASPGTIGTPVYQNDTQGYWWFGGTSPIVVADDLHLAEAGDLVSFTFEIYGLSPSPTFTARINFYEDGANAPGALLASYDVPGIPSNVFWTQTIDLATSVALPQDIWMSVDPLGTNGAANFDLTGPSIGSTGNSFWITGLGTTNWGFSLNVTVRIGEIVGHVDHLGLAVEPSATELEDHTWSPFTVHLLDTQGEIVETVTDPVTISLASGTGTLGGTLVRTPGHGVVTFNDITYDRAETITIDISAPGVDPIQGTVIVTPFDSDLRIEADDVTLTPSGSSIEAGEPTSILARVVNAGNAPATAVVDFWLGDPDIPEVSPQLLGSLPGGVPLGGSSDFSINWIPTEDGLQSLFVVVDNTTAGNADSTPENNRTSRQVSVGAAEQELQVGVDEQIAWPGAINSVPVTITNIGFAPAAISGSSFGPPAWLVEETQVVGTVLAPGESILALVELSVPAGTPGGPLNGTPVAYTLPVEFQTSSGSFAAPLVVKVFDQAASNVTVQVVDDGTSAPIANALVAAQGLPGSFVTDGSGFVTLQLPPGPVGLFAYRTGYIASAATYEIPGGASNAEIRLTVGQTLAIEQVVSEPLSTQEIVGRGVTVSDPVNNTVYDFVVSMEVGAPLVIRNVELPIVPPTVGSDTFSDVVYLPPGEPGEPINEGGRGLGGGGILVTARFDYSIYGRTETWIVIPGEVWALKQFFEVKTFVFNNTTAANPEDVQLRNVTADLDLPAGIGLPDLDGAPQDLLQVLPDLDSQEGAEATWVIRGDLPGSYLLNGLVTADLFAFQNYQTNLTALAESGAFEVTVPRLRCEFLTPGQVEAGDAFEFGVLVTNEASAPAQLVRVALEEADLENCTLVGSEALQSSLVTFEYDASNVVLSAIYTLGDIAPGSSGLAQFQLISTVSGTVFQVETANGCSSAPSPGVTVIAEPPTIVTQPLPATACEGSAASFGVTATGFAPITYQWRHNGVPLPGATGVALNLNGVSQASAGSYDVVVTNPGGETITDSVILIVDTPAVISTQLVPTQVLEGTGTSFSVTVSGSPEPTILWLKNNVVIPGATSSALSLANVSYLASNGAIFTARVTNPCAVVESSAVLTVIPLPPVINLQPVPAMVCAGEDVDFITSAASPVAITYQWRKDGVDISGATGATLSLLNVAIGDAGSYMVVASNIGGDTPGVPAGLVVNEAAAIVTPLSNTFVTEGEPVIFQLSATGVPQPTIEWKKDGVLIPGEASDSLTIASASYSDSATYTATVSNVCASVETEATLDVNRVPIITCNGVIELWSPDHSLVDVSSAFSVTDPDGDDVTLTVRAFSNETEVPETGDGSGKHAPDFKDEQGGRGLLLRSERRGNGDGRWYVLVIEADDGRGGILQASCGVAACPKSQSQASMDAVVAQLDAAYAAIQNAIASQAIAALPLAGHSEHGLSGQVGPIQ